jgi:O-antigen ligase
LLLYFGVGVFTNFAHQLKGSSYDNLSRFLLAIPVLLLLLRVYVRAEVLWSGVALGAAGATVIALWEFIVQGEARASGHINAIQFGDIAMLFFCMLIAILPWAKTQGRAFLIIVCLGALGGLMASLFSGARGGWLMLPVAGLLIYWWNGRRSIAANLLFAASGLLISGALAWLPWLDFLRDRIGHIVLDLQSYQTTLEATNSVGSRLYLWRLSLDMIWQRPLMGWGSFEHYLAATGVQDELLVRFNHMHNDVLDAWVKRGLPGALALLAIYFVPLILFYRELKWHSGTGQSLAARSAALAGIMLVVATCVFGLSQGYLTHSSGVTIYAFMLVILWAQVRQAN